MPEENLNAFLVPRELKLISTKKYRNGYLWVVEKIRTPGGVVCPHCANLTDTRAGRVSVTVRDEPLREKPIFLEIHKHRYYCKACRKYFVETVPGIWPRRRTTQRLRDYIAGLCENFVDLSRVRSFHSVSSGFIYKVYYERAEARLRHFKSSFKWPEVVGIDEHFFRRRNGFTQFVTVMTDLKKKRIFELAEGKSTKDVIEQIQSIPGRENVRLVVIDMSGTYKALAKKMFPNAKIVADKFHVLRLFNPHLMREGKKISGHRQELSLRRMLLKNRVKLDYFVRLEIDRYLKAHPTLDEIYRFKEKLYQFFRCRGFEKAVRSFHRLIAEMDQAKSEEVRKVKETLKRWKTEILLYFENGYTNAFTEQTNRTAKLVQRRACGYKSFKNYRLRTLSACLF